MTVGFVYILAYLHAQASLRYPLFHKPWACHCWGKMGTPMGDSSTRRVVLAHVTIHRDQSAGCPVQDLESVVLLKASIWDDVIAGLERMLAWLGGGITTTWRRSASGRTRGGQELT
jgi:hypothetical protein